jgi:hypothetical protein
MPRAEVGAGADAPLEARVAVMAGCTRGTGAAGVTLAAAGCAGAALAVPVSTRLIVAGAFGAAALGCSLAAGCALGVVPALAEACPDAFPPPPPALAEAGGAASEPLLSSPPVEVE